MIIIWLPLILTLAMGGLELLSIYSELLPVAVIVEDCPTLSTMPAWLKVTELIDATI